MSYDLGPKIGIDGEAEFRKSILNVSQQIKTLGSEMKVVTSAFEAGEGAEESLAKQTQILTDMIAAQEKKISEQTRMLNQAKTAFDETSDETLKWQRAVNESTAELNKMKKQLKDLEKGVENVGDAMENVDDPMDGFVGTFKDFRNSIDSVTGSFGKFKNAIAGGAVVVAIKELGGAILDLEENSREYRQIMGGLMATSEAAGIDAEDAAERYKLLNGVMGDTQAAAEATAQLQTLQATEDQLDEATLSVIGSWTKLGGAAPIETIAESISQTVAASQATGAFSDILMATGQSEEEFNAKLAETTDASARLDLVLQALASAGMKNLGESYLANNEAAIQSNQTQERLNEAYAELGEVVAPVADLLRNGWAGAVEFATGKVETAVEAIMELKSWFDKTMDSIRQMSQWSGQDLWNALTTIPGLETQTRTTSLTSGLTGAELRDLGMRATDVVSAQQAASRNATSAADAMANRGSITTVINIDGREVARATQPYLREEDKANPEVVSDRL